MTENHVHKDSLGRHNPQLVRQMDGFRVGQAYKSPTTHPVPAEATSGPEHHHLAKTPELLPNAHLKPIPVVRMSSARGLEYGMMSVSLWIAAVSLAWILLDLVNGNKVFDSLVLPTAALSVCLPIYMILFFRLKRAELANPRLKVDPSRRRWSQLTQFLAFIAALVDLIIFADAILNRFGVAKPNLPALGKTI